MPISAALRHDAFENDGALRDIYVFGAGPDDWLNCLSALATSGIPYTFDVAGNSIQLPIDRDTLLALPPQLPLLGFTIGPILFNTHFFDLNEIEFDVDPRSFETDLAVEHLIHFMHLLSRATNRCAVFTMENARDWEFFRVSPDGTVIENHAA